MTKFGFDVDIPSLQKRNSTNNEIATYLIQYILEGFFKSCIPCCGCILNLTDPNFLVWRVSRQIQPNRPPDKNELSQEILTLGHPWLPRRRIRIKASGTSGLHKNYRARNARIHDLNPWSQSNSTGQERLQQWDWEVVQHQKWWITTITAKFCSFCIWPQNSFTKPERIFVSGGSGRAHTNYKIIPEC